MPLFRLERLFKEGTLNEGHGRVLRELLRPEPDWRMEAGRTRTIRRNVLYTQEDRKDFENPLEDRPYDVFNREGDQRLHITSEEAEPLFKNGIVETKPGYRGTIGLTNQWQKEVENHFSIDRHVKKGDLNSGHVRVLRTLVYPKENWMSGPVRINTISTKESGRYTQMPLEKRLTWSSLGEENLDVTEDEIRTLLDKGILHAPRHRPVQIHPSWGHIVTAFIQNKLQEEQDERASRLREKTRKARESTQTEAIKKSPAKRDEPVLRERYPREIHPDLATAFKDHFEELLSVVQLRPDPRGNMKWQFPGWMRESDIAELRDEWTPVVKKLLREAQGLFHPDTPQIVRQKPELAEVPKDHFHQVMVDVNNIKDLFKKHDFRL